MCSGHSGLCSTPREVSGPSWLLQGRQWVTGCSLRRGGQSEPEGPPQSPAGSTTPSHRGPAGHVESLRRLLPPPTHGGSPHAHPLSSLIPTSLSAPLHIRGAPSPDRPAQPEVDESGRQRPRRGAGVASEWPAGLVLVLPGPDPLMVGTSLSLGLPTWGMGLRWHLPRGGPGCG